MAKRFSQGPISVVANLFACAAMAAMIMVLSAPAYAEDKALLYAADPAKIADVLRDEGYKAKLTQDSDGDPRIRSAIEGIKYSIYQPPDP